ncbi:MAG TPA: hypothetical protein VE644_12085 [Gaiellaceae bacterium]|nr:hypothetical protein [Gaiellaceae bacterium]
MKRQKVGPRDGERHPLAGDREVRRWRRLQLLALGFSLRDARLLAESPAELGTIRALLARGCPLETARRIVL